LDGVLKELWCRVPEPLRKEREMKVRITGLGKCSLGLLAIALVIPLVGAAYAENEGWLGVMLQPLTDEIMSAMDLDKGTTGVLVSDVVDESPADEADVEEGDVIVEIDGTAVTAVDQAVGLVRSHAAGDQVKLVVLRDGQKQVFTVTLGERSMMEKAMPFEEEEKEFSRVWRQPRVERFFEGPKDFGEGCLRDFGLVKGGHIGVRIQDITADLGSYFGVGENEGVLVVEVVEGSHAAEAGLRGGDVVLKVDGKPVCCSPPFVRAIRDHEPGDQVEITLKRHGETRRLDVEVGKAPRVFERFLGEAGAPGVYMWEEDVPGGSKRLTVRVDDEGCGPMGKEQHKGMMMGKSMDQCMQMCKEMGEKCHGMMGMDMEECMKKCHMMKGKCEGMMGGGSWASMPEGECKRKVMIMKSGDDGEVKCLMKESGVKGELKEELEALRHEIESLKMEIEGLKK
jgi:hypothetical protein